jgi:hypothetical protein
VDVYHRNEGFVRGFKVPKYLKWSRRRHDLWATQYRTEVTALVARSLFASKSSFLQISITISSCSVVGMPLLSEYPVKSKGRAAERKVEEGERSLVGTFFSASR